MRRRLDSIEIWKEKSRKTRNHVFCLGLRMYNPYIAYKWHTPWNWMQPCKIGSTVMVLAQRFSSNWTKIQQMSNAVPTRCHGDTAPQRQWYIDLQRFDKLRDSTHHSCSSISPSSSRIMSSMFGGTYSPSVYGGTFNAITYHTRPSGKLMII